MFHHITKTPIQNSTKTLSSIISKTSSPLAVTGIHINQTAQQERWKHSNRQIKKMRFKQSVMFRNKMLYKNTGVLDDILNKDVPERRFDAVYQPPNGFLPNGWSEPPPEDFVRPEYPFDIERTKNKPNGAVGFLPVYSDIRHGGTKRTTIIRKVNGDLDAFLHELRAVLKIHEPKKNIRVRTGGCAIEINGEYGREVRAWLVGLGF